MPYESIPGVTVSYLDGGLRTVVTSSQPRVLILGPAVSGETNRIFTVSDLSELNNEFGRLSPITQKAHEAFGEGASRISVMRIGGRTGYALIEDSDSGASIRITPSLKDDEVLDSYSLILTLNSDGDLRLLLWDVEERRWVYDSDETLLVNDEKFEIEIEGTWSTDQLCGDITNPDDSTATPLLSDLSGHTSWSEVSYITVSSDQGNDGMEMSWVEWYAALEEAYANFDYRDGDIIVPVGIYFDVPNIAEQDDGSHWESETGSAVYTPSFSSVPAHDDADNNVLGWLWQYLYRGKVYTYFADSLLYDASWVAAMLGTGTVIVEGVEVGPGATPISIEVVGGGSSGGASSSITTDGSGHHIVVTIEDGVTTAATIVSELNSNQSDYISATETTSGVMTTGGPTYLVFNGNYLTHENLTGEEEPSAVLAKFLAGDNSQLREANFGHQLASYCHRASVGWKDMLGVISVRPPSGFGIPFRRAPSISRRVVSEWAGELPELVSFGSKRGVDSPSDNGNGLLGNKFIGGASGYRYAGLDGYGEPEDGLAFGGFALTVGEDLPNGGSWVYGIAPSDEAVDSLGHPVDIGKHIFVTYDLPVFTNTYNLGLAYRSTMEAAFAGKLTTVEENREPIGPVNGTFRTLSAPLPMAPTLTNALASARVCGLLNDGRSGGTQVTLVSCRTFAHPDSDYTRLSTIRCVNRHVRGIRNLAMPFIGGSFDGASVVSLQQAIDGYLRSEKIAGFNSGATARLRYTRADRIAGRMTVELRMVPPFSLEAITVTVSLAADEASL